MLDDKTAFKKNTLSIAFSVLPVNTVEIMYVHSKKLSTTKWKYLAAGSVCNNGRWRTYIKISALLYILSDQSQLGKEN